MSSICPECSQSIEQDFGVAICPKCQSVLNIDIDGNVSLNKKSEEGAVIEEMPVMAPPPIESDFQEDWINNPIPAAPKAHIIPSSVPQPQHHQFNDLSNSESNEMNTSPHSDYQGEELPETNFENSEVDQAQYWPEPTQDESNEVVIEDNVETATKIPTENFEDNQFEQEAEIEAEAVEIVEDSPGLSEVSEFANADQSLGALSYTVLIENIDTKDIRNELLDALTDPKFQWDAKAMMKEIKMGKLQLEGLNPVKASVLVDRLQDIPVKVSWTQHAYS